jgi:hypothetical protein
MLCAERGFKMTDEKALIEKALAEYGTALRFMLTYWDAPERAEDLRWWRRILEREDRAWRELHDRGLLGGEKYRKLILRVHRDADSLRGARVRP